MSSSDEISESERDALRAILRSESRGEAALYMCGIASAFERLKPDPVDPPTAMVAGDGRRRSQYRSDGLRWYPPVGGRTS